MPISQLHVNSQPIENQRLEKFTLEIKPEVDPAEWPSHPVTDL